MADVQHRSLWARFGRVPGVITGCALVSVFALGVLARVWELGKRGLWYDELFCVVGAATSSNLAELDRHWMAVDGHPPGYMGFLYVWFTWVPATEVWARLPSTLVSVALLLYLLIAKAPQQLPMNARLYAAALYSVSSIAIYYAQTSRQYGILMACGVGALIELAAILGSEPRKHRSWLRLVAWLAVAAYLHYLALFLVAAIFLVALVHFYPGRRELEQTMAYALLFGIVYAPGLITLIGRIRLRIAGWQSNEPILKVGKELISRSFFGSWSLVVSFAIVVSVVALALQRRRLRSSLQALLSDACFRAFAAAFAIVAVQLVAFSFVAPFLQLRYALVLYAPLLLIAAMTLAWLIPLRSWGGAVVGVVILAFGVGGFGDYRKTQKQDWRRSAEHVANHAEPNDAIFVVGADPGRAALDYLRSNDVNGYFYSRNIPFYAYYFERIGHPQLARRLVNLPVGGESQREVLEASHAARLFVLAPHHTALHIDTIAALRSRGFRVDELQLFSTRVYRIERPPHVA